MLMLKKYRFKIKNRKQPMIVTAHNSLEALLILSRTGYGLRIDGVGEEV